MNHPDKSLPSSTESVTEWLGMLKAGDAVVGQQLWQRYVERLLRLASRKLGNASKRVADEEDVVLSAFNALLQGVAEGRFVQIDDRDDLWQLLLMLTERKAIGVRRREQAEKRGGGEVRGESALDGPPGLGQVAGAEPTPEFAAQLVEDFAQRLATLGEQPQLQQIACDKLAGYTNIEIAERLGCSVRSVERQLNLIRKLWTSDPMCPDTPWRESSPRSVEPQ